MAKFLKSRTAYRLFAPVRLFYRFIKSPWFWVFLSFLLAATGVVTLCWRSPKKDWQEIQSRNEFIGAVLMLIIAVSHKYIFPAVWRFAPAKWVRSIIGKIYKGAWKPVVIVILSLVIIFSCFRIHVWQKNDRLADELYREYEEWVAGLPRIPEDENGMYSLLEAAEPFTDQHMDELTYDEFSLSNPEDMKVLDDLLEEYGDALSSIDEVLKKHDSYLFNPNYENPNAINCPDIFNLKQASILISKRAEKARLENRYSDAIKDCITILKLARTQRIESHYYSYFLEINLKKTGLTQYLKTTSEKPTFLKSELTEILNELDSLYYEKNLAGIFNHDYIFKIRVIADVIKSEYSWYELFRDTWSSSGQLARGAKRNTGSKILKFIRFAKMELGIYDYSGDVELIRKEREISHKYYTRKIYEIPEKYMDSDLLKKEYGIKYDDGTPAEELCHFFMFYNLETKTYITSLYRGAIVLTGIRLFEKENGRLPESLSELDGIVDNEMLIDPFSGKEFIYRVLHGDFKLYSVGANGKDDNCLDSPPIYETNLGMYEYDEINDIVFHIAR